MEDIICPNCGSPIKINENNYADIVKQVKDKEFKKALEEAKSAFEERKEAESKIMELAFDKKYQEMVNSYESKITELTNVIDSSENRKNIAVKETEMAKDELLSEKELEIIKLQNMIDNFEAEKQIAINDAVRAKDDEINQQKIRINELDSQIKTDSMQHQTDLITVKNEFKAQIKAKDEEIEFYKDFKAKQSTKMVGESLEQYCMNEFNKYRATIFKKAYFEKDNDASTGSKGDFIYKDFTDDNVEFVSVMFEMKNECDTTATKKTNESFFKELDKDRREKNCEYAVLVSMLESDNDLYNNGIVNVSYRYEKMYVIRPQFFLPMIMLLRDAAMNSADYQRELSLIRHQNIDISRFEENMNEFKVKFQTNYENASNKFTAAMDEIDKTIDHLKKVKENLRLSITHLNSANNKAQDLSIKKLTKGNPTMEKKFKELAQRTEDNIE